MDAESGLLHTVIGTAANVNDVTQAGALLHGQETSAFGDAGHRGADKRAEAKGPEWFFAMQLGTIGATELIRTWTDKDFDPAAQVAYYARVLEMPTPRWSTHWAAQAGVAAPTKVPATVQERAWSSPIWYTGDAR